MIEAKILGIYTGMLLLFGGVTAVDGLRRLIRKWRELPEVSWFSYSLIGGILLLFAAGVLELSIWTVSREPLIMALSIGFVEESLKLSPALILLRKRAKYSAWKLTIGAAMMFALFESLSYIAASIITPGLRSSQISLFMVRFIVIVFHMMWTAVPLSYLLYGRKSWALMGWLFAVLAHSAYDYPVLAILGGESRGTVTASAVLAIVFVILLRSAVARALDGVTSSRP